MTDFPSFLGGRVTVKVGDITREAVDAVVNAANGTLMGGGGVDGAIHRAGGPAILEECRGIRATRYQDGLPTGGAVLTTAGRMPARHVIHTVGPVYGSGGPDKAEKLACCYRNSLRIAADERLATVAFPAISTGIYGYPMDEAAAVSSRAIQDALGSCPSIREVRLVFFLPADAEVFVRHQIFGAGDT
ncbi:MAG: O-acetyl-ADP-ribose deacetylase [Deltaproteobacteria bacterium]|nr:O-acetyl-ADP-ribose deacetylase [Deltaproteobacteria bacterium]